MYSLKLDHLPMGLNKKSQVFGRPPASSASSRNRLKPPALTAPSPIWFTESISRKIASALEGNGTSGPRSPILGDPTKVTRKAKTWCDSYVSIRNKGELLKEVDNSLWKSQEIRKDYSLFILRQPKYCSFQDLQIPTCPPPVLCFNLQPNLQSKSWCDRNVWCNVKGQIESATILPAARPNYSGWTKMLYMYLLT